VSDEKEHWKPATRLIHDGDHGDARFGAVVPPLYQNSTFAFESWDALDAAFEDRTGTPVYSRQVNPSVRAAEAQLAKLTGCERARLFASGMAAISAAIMHCLRQDDHAITIRNVYGPAANFLGSYLPEKMGVRTTFVAGDNVDEIEAAINDDTRLIYLESPSSGRFTLQDIAAIASLARPRGIRLVCDNTWATPLYQDTLALGADLEIHSVSKYLGGHSDICAGAVASRKDLISLIHKTGLNLGGSLNAITLYLLERSIKTLDVRIQQINKNAQCLAEFLVLHPAVGRVNYPGLPEHPGYEIAKKQMQGFGGMLSFELKEVDSIEFQKKLKLIKSSMSLGGVETIVSSPAHTSHRHLGVDGRKKE